MKKKVMKRGRKSEWKDENQDIHEIWQKESVTIRSLEEIQKALHHQQEVVWFWYTLSSKTSIFGQLLSTSLLADLPASLHYV